METVRKYLRALRSVLLAAAGVSALLGIVDFPYDVDAPLTQHEIAAAQNYYADAYRAPVNEGKTTSEYETKYLRLAEEYAKAHRIEDRVKAFAREFKLSNRAVLEIGSGRGYLQDVVKTIVGKRQCCG